MEFKLKDMSYGLLLSHTFPGLLFGLEILLAFELGTNLHLISLLQAFENNMANLIAFLLGTFIFSTLLGFILDGIHHFIFEDVLGLMKRDEGYHGSNSNFYNACNSIERMQIYKHFLEDDLWYPYEAYANISIAMLPGSILLPYWLHHLEVGKWFLITSTIVYIIILIIVIYEANSTLNKFKEEERCFINNFNCHELSDNKDTSL